MYIRKYLHVCMSVHSTNAMCGFFKFLKLSLQSAVTVYSPFDGVVKELLYAVDDLASQGKPLVMIEVKGSEGKSIIIIIMMYSTEHVIGTAASNVVKLGGFFPLIH